MNIFQEELLEPIARAFRFHHGFSEIDKKEKITLVDLGCGPKIRFYSYAKERKLKFERYIGIDPLISKAVIDKNSKANDILLIKNPLKNRLPIDTNSVDFVTAFAFLEHIDHPETILLDSIRILKKGGKAIYTTPTPKAKNILEFLSFKLGLISEREIKEHKNYFDKENLDNILKRKEIKVSNIKHSYFEMGLNNLLVITK